MLRQNTVFQKSIVTMLHINAKSKLTFFWFESCHPSFKVNEMNEHILKITLYPALSAFKLCFLKGSLTI